MAKVYTCLTVAVERSAVPVGMSTIYFVNHGDGAVEMFTTLYELHTDVYLEARS